MYQISQSHTPVLEYEQHGRCTTGLCRWPIRVVQSMLKIEVLLKNVAVTALDHCSFTHHRLLHRDGKLAVVKRTIQTPTVGYK